MALRKGIVSVAGQEVKVKNTFLDDVLEDSSPESARNHVERSTCPVFSRQPIEASSFEAPAELLEPIRAPWPSEMTTMDSFNPPNDRMSWSSIASGYEPDMPIKVISRDVPAAPAPPMKPALRSGTLPAPSVGSQRHGRGETCVPCPFFWKSSGCIEGRSCKFCHLCPEQAPAKTGPSRGLSVTIAKEEAGPLSDGYAKFVADGVATGVTASQEHEKVLEMQQKLCPSIFEDHASGTCKPCTFFWKPEGCRKSEGCHHCHLCPPSALKDRKLQKVMARRQEKSGHKGSKGDSNKGDANAPLPTGLIYL